MGLGDIVSACLVAIQGAPWIPNRCRKRILTLTGSRFGKLTYIDSRLEIRGARLFLGQNVYINKHLHVDGEGEVRMGDNIQIGPNCTFITAHHDIMPDNQCRASPQTRPTTITIGDGCWIGAGVIILPGVNIAGGCVIGAGAVVTKDTEANGVYMGVPAKRIKELPVQRKHGASDRN